MIYYIDTLPDNATKIIVKIEQPPEGYSYHSIGQHKYDDRNLIAFINAFGNEKPFLWICDSPYFLGTKVRIRQFPSVINEYFEYTVRYFIVTEVEVKQVKDLTLYDVQKAGWIMGELALIIPAVKAQHPDWTPDTWIELATLEEQ